jgi:hypothetical protein
MEAAILAMSTAAFTAILTVGAFISKRQRGHSAQLELILSEIKIIRSEIKQ